MAFPVEPVHTLTVTVISISSHEVDTVAVFIPEGSFIGQGTVGDSNVIVMVVSGEWTTVVVGHRVSCSSTISSYVDFVAGPRFRDRELVILSVGCFTLISQVDSQLILTSSCDLMQVGKTQPEFIIHVTKASCVILPVPEKF